MLRKLRTYVVVAACFGQSMCSKHLALVWANTMPAAQVWYSDRDLADLSFCGKAPAPAAAAWAASAHCIGATVILAFHVCGRLTGL